MLKEDQAAELLARCERLLGRRLDQLRGRLKRAESRAAAVWELICIDAFSQIGAIDHEPPGESSPDIVLRSLGNSVVWIEIAYLYPRFWENDRQARELLVWIYQEAARLKIPEARISSHFFGDNDNAAGPIRALPYMHEKSKVLALREVRDFFEAIGSQPKVSRSVTLAPYTVTLKYDPDAVGSGTHSSGVVEEQPTTVEEHALFRALREKTRQHKPDSPYVVCVGTDQNRAISRYGKSFGVTERHAVVEIFRTKPRVSAVIVVGIETSLAHNSDFRPVAFSRLYQNPQAVRPLEPAHIDAFSNLDFNRWRFYFPLEKWEPSDDTHFHRSGGPLTMSDPRSGTISLTVPSTILVDCLAGRTSLGNEYPDRPDDSLRMLKCIEDGWQVIGCSFEPGSIEGGLSSRVMLVLCPPPERVFGMG
jgi:hypothetical protein